jgi:hypothetical protein
MKKQNLVYLALSNALLFTSFQSSHTMASQSYYHRTLDFTPRPIIEIFPNRAGSIENSNIIEEMDLKTYRELVGDMGRVLPLEEVKASIYDFGIIEIENSQTRIKELQLTGILPRECSEKVQFARIRTKAEIGFSVVDKGGLQSCLTRFQGSNACTVISPNCVALSSEVKSLPVEDRNDPALVRTVKYSAPQFRGGDPRSPNNFNPGWTDVDFEGGPYATAAVARDAEQRAAREREDERIEHYMNVVEHCQSERPELVMGALRELYSMQLIDGDEALQVIQTIDQAKIDEFKADLRRARNAAALDKLLKEIASFTKGRSFLENQAGDLSDLLAGISARFSSLAQTPADYEKIQDILTLARGIKGLSEAKSDKLEQMQDHYEVNQVAMERELRSQYVSPFSVIPTKEQELFERLQARVQDACGMWNVSQNEHLWGLVRTQKAQFNSGYSPQNCAISHAQYRDAHSRVYPEFYRQPGQSQERNATGRPQAQGHSSPLIDRNQQLFMGRQAPAMGMTQTELGPRYPMSQYNIGAGNGSLMLRNPAGHPQGQLTLPPTPQFMNYR